MIVYFVGFKEVRECQRRPLKCEAISCHWNHNVIDRSLSAHYSKSFTVYISSLGWRQVLHCWGTMSIVLLVMLASKNLWQTLNVFLKLICSTNRQLHIIKWTHFFFLITVSFQKKRVTWKEKKWNICNSTELSRNNKNVVNHLAMTSLHKLYTSLELVERRWKNY